jgi:hypothetical protein
VTGIRGSHLAPLFRAVESQGVSRFRFTPERAIETLLERLGFLLQQL